MDPWNDFNDVQFNIPDCSQLDSLVSVYFLYQVLSLLIALDIEPGLLSQAKRILPSYQCKWYPGQKLENLVTKDYIKRFASSFRI